MDEYAELHDRRFRAHVVDDPSEIPDALWRFGVEYADGLRITTVDARIIRGGSIPGHPDIVISELWSSGHFTENPHPYWFSPAPPPGMLRLAVEWPLAGVPFSPPVSIWTHWSERRKHRSSGHLSALRSRSTALTQTLTRPLDLSVCDLPASAQNPRCYRGRATWTG